MSLLAMGQPNVFIYALRPPAVIIAHQKFGQQVNDSPISLFVTHAFHPLPDRDRSRIANAG
jgi:hypothetical protein